MYQTIVKMYSNCDLALTLPEERRDVDDCNHVECPEDDYELEFVRESCACTHSMHILIGLLHSNTLFRL